MSERVLDGRVAIVTGSGRGIGRAEATRLASYGARVVVNDVGAATDGAETGETPADEAVAEIGKAGGEAIADAHDISTPDGGEALVQTALDTWGRIDIVVNNAGIGRPHMVFNLEDAEWADVLRVHLTGTFSVSRPACRWWRAEHKAGRGGYGPPRHNPTGGVLCGGGGEVEQSRAQGGGGGVPPPGGGAGGAPRPPTHPPRSGRSSTGRAAPSRRGKLRERVADRLAAALQRLHVEEDRQQVLHVESARGDVADDEVVVLLDADAVVLLLVPLDLLELLVDLFAGGEQEPEVVVAGRLHGLVALGEQDELLCLLGQEDVAHLTDDLGVDARPAEHAPVEGVDLFAELGGERPARERQLHVVEPHRRHQAPVR